jgi:abortive infection bacteriophage resistance protein
MHQITAKSFDYDKFTATLEEQDQFISDWIKNEHDHDVPLWIVPPVDLWTYDTCRRREEFLHKNLELLHKSME